MRFSGIEITPLVLASASPRRREILERLGFTCVVEPANIDEESIRDNDAQLQTKRIARAKGNAVAKKGNLTVSADTIVYFDGTVLEKPRNADHARAMLRNLSGREHSVYTAVALVFPQGHEVEFLEETRVTFRAIADDTIEEYIQSDSPYDKAGGYGVQDAFGMAHILRIEGCYYNVMGFPASRFMEVLAKNRKFLL